jgi:hypothetical protein
MSKAEIWVTSRDAHLEGPATFSRCPPRAGGVQRAIRNIAIFTNGQQQQSAHSGEIRIEVRGISLVNVGLATLDVPLWWVDFCVCDLRGVELREINSQSLCFVVIIDREMTDDNIATGTYTITSKEDLA